MNALTRYIEFIVEPTFEDFKRNPNSVRHAFLACVAVFHAIDRASQETRVSRGNLRKEWGKKTPEFKFVDIVAHHFKHVQSDDEKVGAQTPGIPIAFALGLSDTGDTLDLHNFFFVVRDAVKFLHKEAAALDRRKRQSRAR
jgi:hypothetical protein